MSRRVGAILVATLLVGGSPARSGEQSEPFSCPLNDRPAATAQQVPEPLDDPFNSDGLLVAYSLPMTVFRVDVAQSTTDANTYHLTLRAETRSDPRWRYAVPASQSEGEVGVSIAPQGMLRHIGHAAASTPSPGAMIRDIAAALDTPTADTSEEKSERETEILSGPGPRASADIMVLSMTYDPTDSGDAASVAEALSPFGLCVAFGSRRSADAIGGVEENECARQFAITVPQQEIVTQAGAPSGTPGQQALRLFYRQQRIVEPALMHKSGANWQLGAKASVAIWDTDRVMELNVRPGFFDTAGAAISFTNGAPDNLAALRENPNILVASTTDLPEAILDDGLREMRSAALAGDTPRAASALARLADVARARLLHDPNRLGSTIENIADAGTGIGLYRESEAILREALEAARRAGSDSDVEIQLLLALVRALTGQGNFKPAEQAIETALELLKGKSDPITLARALNERAALNHYQGRLAAAEKDYRSAAAAVEQIPLNSLTPTILNNLAELYRISGRDEEAEALYVKVVRMYESGNFSEIQHGLTLNNLALVYLKQQRLDTAAATLERAIQILIEAGGPEHREVGRALSNLARVMTQQGRYREAGEHFERALRIRQSTNQTEAATTLNYLGELRLLEGRPSEARDIFLRSLAIREATLPPHHPDIAVSLANLASARMMDNKTSEALALSRRAVEVARAGQRLAGGFWGTQLLPPGADRVSVFTAHIAQAYRAADGDSSLLDEAFKAAQSAHATGAARAMSQLALRLTQSNAETAAAVRCLQDLVQRLELVQRAMIDGAADLEGDISRASFAEESKRLENHISSMHAALTDKIGLPVSDELSVQDVQRLLKPNEVLVFFVAFPETLPTVRSGFAFMVPAVGEPIWYQTGIDQSGIAESVAALRCGLDAATWRGAGQDKCQALLASTFTRADATDKKLLPFDLRKAQGLYQALFGCGEALLKNADGSPRHLIVVPSGALTGLPLQVLVADGVGGGPLYKTADYVRASWLGARHAITVLPSVSSLRFLRRDARTSEATRPYLAIGNPQLEGGRLDGKKRALAKSWQSCRTTDLAGVCQAAFPRMTSGKPLDGAKLNEWSPLPQTACELCSIGSRLPSVDVARDVKLGRSATETEVKRMGRQVEGTGRSELQSYRVVHFATHGVISDVRQGYDEPGLILTPPAEREASSDDDGYLAASEVAELKLDADLVILSACNTAAGSAQNSEALAGLASAFLYAGARALLVSNWEVYTNAAVDFTTRTLSNQAEIGRADAVQLAISGMIDDARSRSSDHRIHPSYWGPFSLVGEGAERGLDRH